MKKILLILLLCMISVAYAENITEQYKQQILEPQLRQERLQRNLLVPTEILGDNTARVDTEDISLIIDTFKASKEDTITISISASENINSICFDFPISIDLIRITEIKINKPFWVDEDLKQYEEIINNSICYVGLDVQAEDIYFNAEYLGYGEIKYNISTSLGILDPYLIGYLATDLNLGAYFPFDGNISAIFASKPLSLTNLNTRYIAPSYEGYTGNTPTAPLYTIDNSYSTSSSTGAPYCGAQYYTTYNYNVSKLTADTGLVLELTNYQGSHINYTIPSSCFNVYSDRAYFSIYTTNVNCNLGAVSGYGLYCFDGSNQQLVYEYGGPDGYSRDTIYEIKAFMTNQSGYVAYNNTLPQSAYVNYLNLTAGYVFAVNQNSNDISGNAYNGINSNIVYNSSGANFNGINSSINTTFKPNITNSDSYTIHSRFHTNMKSTPQWVVWKEANQLGDSSFGLGIYSLWGGIACFISTNVTNHWVSYTYTNNTDYTIDCIKSNNNTITMYVNGQFYQSYSTPANEIIRTNGNTYFTLGRDWVNGNYLNGSISQVQIFNRSLSSSEILALSQYNNASNILNETNKALNLDGNSIITIQNISLPTGSSPVYSISYWLYNWTSPSADSAILGTGDNGFVIVRDASNSSRVAMYHNGVAYPAIYATLKSSTAWHHYVWTSNGSTFKSYVDGILDTTTTTTSSYSMAGQPYLEIGGSPTYPTSRRNAMIIDEVMVFNKVLTQNEVNALYNGYNLTPIIGVCNSDPRLAYQIMNIIPYDEKSNSIISADLGINLVAFDGNNTLSFSGSALSTTNLSICTNIPSSYINYVWLVNGTATISKTDYITRIYNLLPFYLNNSNTYIFPVYTLSSGNSSTVQYSWKTRQLQLIDGTMEVYKCLLNGSRNLVESLAVVQGYATANIELYYQPYSYEMIIDGVRYSDANSYSRCHIEGNTNLNYFIDVLPSTMDSTIGLWFTNCNINKTVPNEVQMSWSSNPNDDSNITACIIAQRQEIYGYVEIYRNCTNASYGTMVRSIPNNSNTYNVHGEIYQNGDVGLCRQSVTFNKNDNNTHVFGIAALFAIAILVASLALLYAGDGVKQVLAAIGGLIAAWILGITMLSWETVSLLLGFCIFIVIIARYSRRP